MTNSKTNLRRSVGPRRPGRDETDGTPEQDDPLAELTRFMGGEGETGDWARPQRPTMRPRPAPAPEPVSTEASQPDDEDPFDTEAERHTGPSEAFAAVRAAFQEPPASEAEAESDPLPADNDTWIEAEDELWESEEVDQSVEDVEARAPDADEDFDDDLVSDAETDASPDDEALIAEEDEAAPEPIEAAVDETEELAEEDAQEPEHEPEEPDDPFMLALMEELDGDQDTAAAKAEAPRKEGPSFAFGADKDTAASERAPASSFIPRATPRAVPAEPIGASPAQPASDRTPSEPTRPASEAPEPDAPRAAPRSFGAPKRPSEATETPPSLDPSPVRAPSAAKAATYAPPRQAFGQRAQAGAEPTEADQSAAEAPETESASGSETTATIAALNRLRDRFGRRDDAEGEAAPSASPTSAPEQETKRPEPAGPQARSAQTAPASVPPRRPSEPSAPVASEPASTARPTPTFAKLDDWEQHPAHRAAETPRRETVTWADEAERARPARPAVPAAEEQAPAAARTGHDAVAAALDVDDDTDADDIDFEFDLDLGDRDEPEAAEAEAAEPEPERPVSHVAPETPAETEDDAESPAMAVPTVRPRRAVPSFRFDLGERRPAQEEPEPRAEKPRGFPLGDLPGVSDDAWHSWPAAKTPAAKAPEAKAQSTGEPAGVADQLADALFSEDEPDETELPRILARRIDAEDEDFSDDRGDADRYADDEAVDGEGYDEDYYDDEDDYYDEAEPEWEDDESLPPHSMREMDAALGLAEPPKRRRIGRIVAAVAIVAVLGGVGYYVFGMTTGTVVDDGPPRVIQANADGVKVMPEGGAADDQGNKTITDRVGEESGRLVQSSEEPIDPSQSASESASSPMLPKRVRTLVVRPDGTIVPSDELEPAGASQPLQRMAGESSTSAPASDSTAPAASGEDAATQTSDATPLPGTSGSEDAAASSPATSDRILPDDGTSADSETQTAAAEPSEPSQLSPIRTSERLSSAAPPLPKAREDTGTRSVSTTRVTSQSNRAPLSLVPNGETASAPATTSSTAASPSSVGQRTSASQQAANAQRANQQATASTTSQTSTASQAASASAASSAPWSVQVSSQRSQDQAEAAYRQLQQRFPSILGSRSPDIQVADLGTRGTFYRVRLPAQTRDAANQLCSELKAAGGDCFIGRN